MEPLKIKDLHVGQEVVIHNRLTGEDSVALVTNISNHGKAATAGNLRFGEDGWRFEASVKFDMCLYPLTDMFRAQLHRKELLEKLRGILWEGESTLTLELMVKVYESGKALTREEKEIY